MKEKPHDRATLAQFAKEHEELRNMAAALAARKALATAQIDQMIKNLVKMRERIAQTSA